MRSPSSLGPKATTPREGATGAGGQWAGNRATGNVQAGKKETQHNAELDDIDSDNEERNESECSTSGDRRSRSDEAASYPCPGRN